MQYDKQTRKDMYRTIASWKQSGLSQKAYCEQNNIRYYVFHYWYKRYRNQQGAVNDNPFIPLDIKSAPRLPACSANIEMISCFISLSAAIFLKLLLASYAASFIFLQILFILR
jgi:hypothetical protein